MHRYAVGELFRPGKTRWPDNRFSLSIGKDGVHLALLLARPNAAEVKAVKKAPARFAWITGENGAMLAFSFTDHRGAGLPWSDQPYHAGRDNADYAGVPGETGTQILASIYLVDSTTGILKAIRTVSWPAAASDAVRATIAAQLDRPFNAAAHDSWLSALYTRYPHTQQLVDERADITWTGGDTTATPGTGTMASPPPRAAQPEPGSPQAIIAQYLGGITTSGRAYLQPLPDDLAPWHCYLADSGHSIVIALADSYTPGGDPAEFLVPASVKSVLRAGYTIKDGYVVCDLPYDPDLGLVTPDDEYEF